MKSTLQKLWQHKSALVLIAANLVPLFGVLLFGWSAFDVVYLFWLENVVIGGFNVCKMLTFGLLANPDFSTGQPTTQPVSWPHRLAVLGGLLFMAGFFCFHYGMFTYVHGVFVLAFGQFGPAAPGGGAGNAFNVVGTALDAIRGDFAIPFLALVVSHGFSFVYNFLYHSEYKKVSMPALMQGPYGRVIVMHMTVLIGGFLSLFLPSFMVILLVVFKTALDVKFHLKERAEGAIRLVKRGTRTEMGGEA